MAKIRSRRITSGTVAFHLVGVLGLVALGCGGSSSSKVDAHVVDARPGVVPDANPGDALVAPGDGGALSDAVTPQRDGTVLSDVASPTSDGATTASDGAASTTDGAGTDALAADKPVPTGDGGGAPDTTGAATEAGTGAGGKDGGAGTTGTGGATGGGGATSTAGATGTGGETGGGGATSTAGATSAAGATGTGGATGGGGATSTAGATGTGGATGGGGATSTAGTPATGGIPGGVVPPATGGATGTGGSTGAVDAGLDGSSVDASPPDASVTGPQASFSSTPIVLAATACGATSAASTITITNSGTSDLIVTASVGTPFTVTPSTATTIGAGANQVFSVGVTVPSSATAGTALSGTLTVATNDPAHSSTPISLSVTPQGGTLVWDTASPQAANFGQQPIDEYAPSIALTLRNTGNAPITVTPGSVGTPFSLTPTTAQPVDVNGTLSLAAGFHPTTTSPASATSTLGISGTLCGTSVSSVSLSGQGITSDLSGWPTGLNFGLNPCGGAAPAAQSFTVTNAGALAAHITGATFVAGTPGYATDAAGQTIPAGGSLVVHVTAPAIAPTPPAVPGDYSDTLTITTDSAGDTPHSISVNEGAKGAILVWNTTATSGFGAFGSVPVGTTVPQTFEVDNNGNDGASVTLTTTTPFSVGTANFSVGGSPHSDTLSFAPSVLGAASSTLAMSVSGTTVLCAPLPTALNVGGVGQGWLSLSAQSLTFTASCGQQAGGKSVVVTNLGNADIGWTGALGLAGSSPFTIDTLSGTLAPAGSVTIGVQPNTLPQNGYGLVRDTLTITPDVGSLDSPHQVTLTLTPQGDVIVLNPPTVALNFGTVPVTPTGQTQQRSFNISNNANAGSPDAQVTLTPSDAHFTIVESSPITVAAGNTTTVHVIFAPGTNNPGDAVERDGTIALNFGSDVLCAVAPADPTVTGTGTLAQVSLDKSTLTFGSNASDPSGLVACGHTGPAQTVTLSNPGTQDYNVTSALLSNTTYYSVSPTSGLVAANGGTLLLTVTPNAIDSTSAVPAASKYSGTLTIHTDAAFETSTGHVVTLTMGAKGIIIDNNLSTTTWDFGSETPYGTKLYNSPIRNHGNISASVSLTGLTTPNIFGLASTPTTVSAGDGSADVVTNIQGTFTPNAADQVWTDQGMLLVSAPANEEFCQPLPASWGAPTITLMGSSPAVPVLLTLASVQNEPYGIAVDGTNVYWTNQSGGTVMKVLKNGGGAPVTLASGQDSAETIAVDGTNVYWANWADGTVMAVPIAGGTPTTLASGQDVVYGIAVDGNNVYWTDLNYGAVMAVPVGGGTPTTLASNQVYPLGIAVESGTVYWTNYFGGTVMTVPTGGGTPVTLTSGQNRPAFMTVYATNLYWSDLDYGTVMAMPTSGGTPTTLASGQDYAWAIAADGTNVYWTNSGTGTVMSVPIGGGTPTTLASGQGGSLHGIAVDTTSVFWTSLGNSTVMQLTPK